MKKVLLAAAVVGLVAVPSIVSARHGADDTNKANDVRQEDRRADRQADKKATATQSVTATSTETENETGDDSQAATNNSSPTTVGGVVVETEGNAQLPEDAVALNTAQEKAQAVFPDKTITKVEIEHEHGSVVYSFRFSDGSRVDVDASTGEVVRTKNKHADNRNNTQSNRGSNSGHGSDDDSSNDD